MLLCTTFKSLNDFDSMYIFIIYCGLYVKIGCDVKHIQNSDRTYLNILYNKYRHEFNSTRLERKDQVGEQPSELPVSSWRK